MTKSSEATSALFGAFDMNVRMVESAFDVRISNRNKETEDGDALIVSGEREAVDMAARVLEYLKHMVGEGESLSEQSVEYVIGLVKDNLNPALKITHNGTSLPSCSVIEIIFKIYHSVCVVF